MSGRPSTTQGLQPPKPKGILKKTPPAPAPAPAPALPTFDEDNDDAVTDYQMAAHRDYQLAVQQAKLLLEQRDQIPPTVPLETFERLSTFPPTRGPGITAANPAPEDARDFLTTIAGFLPREYMDLVDERNCVGNCGYALCPRPKRNREGLHSIKMTGIARTEDVNKWCSDRCALRALFIHVQLQNPSYVWKDGKTVVKVELRAEDAAKQQPGQQTPRNGKQVASPSASSSEQLAQTTGEADRDKKRQITKEATALAVERGDAGRLPGVGNQIEITIREKSSTAPAQAPDRPSDEDRDRYEMVEGHRIKFGNGKTGKNEENEDSGSEDDDDDDDDDYLPPTLRM
ncbi:hypothetical protein B0T22DRAFT_439026 [Podospora appendiculata]|uniref:RNA polymerase II subunit B1 CTD phosphatase RPAP2 homolog n=1 Tax=Podospora appendiculata TaxID=314037 RepID=A0AAE0X7C4_9PEZI|nr:hypothetical protein B0T22DRAFT_439026 [Podospora appendiculata]